MGMAMTDERLDFTDRITQRLSAADVGILHDAVDLVDDQLMQELADAIANEDGRARFAVFSGLHLPSQYEPRYDARMLRRLHVCFVQVVGRLEAGWRPCQCRGEELVLRAIIDMAREEGLSEDSAKTLLDLLFDDLDHEYLFNMAFDGIADPDDPQISQLGVHSLHPDEWFKPWFDNPGVHPLARV